MITFSDKIVNERKSEIAGILPQWRTHVLDLQESAAGDVAGERKLHFLVEIQSKDEFRQWLTQFEDINKINYTVRSTKPALGKHVTFTQRLLCQHNTRVGRTHDPTVHKVTKNTNCPSKIIVSIHAKHDKYKGKFIEKGKFYKQLPCEIKLTMNHNHSVSSAVSLRFRQPSSEVKEKLISLFQKGHSPATALECIKTDIQLNFPDDPLILEDRSKCPDYFFCYNFYAKLRKTGLMEPLCESQTDTELTDDQNLEPMDAEVVSREIEVPDRMDVEKIPQKTNYDLINGIHAILTDFSERSPEEMRTGLQAMHEKLKKIKTPSACAALLLTFDEGKTRKLVEITSAGEKRTRQGTVWLEEG